MHRPDIHEYYLSLAGIVSARSTCPRLSVGAVLTSKGNVVSLGYNGAPRGMPHCSEKGCTIIGNHCINVVHAELNCLLHAATTDGGILYITHAPCIECCKAIINARVSEVYFTTMYVDDRCDAYGMKDQLAYLLRAGVVVTYSPTDASESFLDMQDTHEGPAA